MSSNEDLFKPGNPEEFWKEAAAGAAPDRDNFQVQGLQQMRGQLAGRELYSAGQASRSLQDALAARQGQKQSAGMLADRAAGRGPSVAALQGQQAVAQAGQGANAEAAGGRGPGGMALAQRLAMARGREAAGEAAMQAAAGRNREVGQSQAALGQALAQMRQGDIGESSQNAATSKAYFDAQMRVRQEQSAMAAAYDQSRFEDMMRAHGYATQDAAFYDRLAQSDLESRRHLQGSILSAGGSMAGFALQNSGGSSGGGGPSEGPLRYDQQSGIYRGNPYG